ncbi:MAG: hypothetical protein ACRDSK_09765 [Actinophytocola sp.]|uniref:TolB family protein n=1 Tax=Actinophytocola sp. TaxID=1872138 RepID=UPI003D6C1A10
MRRIGTLVVGLGSAALLAGCAVPTVSGSAFPDRVHAESLRVTDERRVDVRGPVRLSPDGTRVLRLDPRLCVTALDGSGEQCVDNGDDGGTVRPDPLHAQWSPDGTRIVFTDDFWRQLREPDVWMFDLRTGEVRNLTDDGVAELDLGGADPRATVDLLPSWSPDGIFVRFARGTMGADTTSLMSLNVEHGELAGVREVSCATPQVTALAWSAKRVAWTCGVAEPEVRVAEVSRFREWTMLPPKGGEDRTLLSFSPDGEALLVDSMAQYRSLDSDGGRARVVPAAGGEPRPVAAGRVGFPAWVPGADAIAYVELPGTLKVVLSPLAERPAPARELRAVEGLAAPDGMRLNWGGNGLLAMRDGDPTLLTITE